MDQNSAPRLPALILLKSRWPEPASCARSKFSSTKRPGVSAWVSTMSAELWMARAPVAAPLGEIVSALEPDFAGGDACEDFAAGVAVWAIARAEKNKTQTNTWGGLGMSVIRIR